MSDLDDKQQQKLIFLHDQAWATVCDSYEDICRISDEGPTTERDNLVVKMVMKFVAGSIISRRSGLGSDDK